MTALRSPAARPRPVHRIGASFGAVFRHQLRRTRKSWLASIAAGVATPSLFLFAIGAGLGSQIDDGELAKLGVDSYIDYIGPGVLIVTAMQIAGNEAMWPTMGLLRWHGIYKAVLATPIASTELAAAHVGWIGFRSMVSATLFLSVLAIAGAISSWFGLAIPLVAMAIAWVHAAPLVGLTAGLKKEDIYPLLNRIVLFPLFLFSGAFFPVDDMPAAVAFVAKITPTWHGVELARHLGTGDVGSSDLLHLGYLVILSATGFVFAQQQFKKHLEV